MVDKVKQAREGAQPIIDELCKLNARCMEQLDHKSGIVVERWLLPNGTSVVVFGTPHWRDAFVPVSDKNEWQATFLALRKAAEAKHG